MFTVTGAAHADCNGAVYTRIQLYCTFAFPSAVICFLHTRIVVLELGYFLYSIVGNNDNNGSLFT